MTEAKACKKALSFLDYSRVKLYFLVYSCKTFFYDSVNYVYFMNYLTDISNLASNFTFNWLKFNDSPVKIS